VTREEYDRWRFEQELVETLLGRVELVERGILAEIGCPSDPVAIFDALSQPQTWKPKRLAARNKQRALDAMWTLKLIEQTRGALALGHENARHAAHYALLAGLHAGDGALNAVKAIQARQQAIDGGRARGKQTTKTARLKRNDVDRLLRRYEVSDELQETYRSPTSYVRKQTGLSPSTVRRHAKKKARQ